MKPEVSIEGLGYRYRTQQKPALDGVDLEVAEGEFVVVMGPSGPAPGAPSFSTPPWAGGTRWLW
jgi:energy-coupling factor transporter ATP-binding protein EcfA2